MLDQRRAKQLKDSYRFPGFTPSSTVRGVFGDSKARVIDLARREKKRGVVSAVACNQGGTIAKFGAYAIFPAATPASTSSSKSEGSSARIAAQ